MTVSVEVGGHQIGLSHLEKVMYPVTGTTKAGVLDYYARVAPRLLPWAERRPVTRIRWPDGTGSPSFYEKDLPRGTPDWVPRFRTRHGTSGSGKGERDVDYPMLTAAEGLATLTWLGQQGALELHTPQWRVAPDGRPAPPDRLVIDLDPGAPAGLPECCTVAGLVRVALAHHGLDGRVVTSGSKGLQIYADVPADHPAAVDTAALARELAQALAAAMPELVEWRMAKELRGGKVFLDWSQNHPAKTTIAPWSLRGKESPTVATPVSWDEVGAGLQRQFTMTEALERAATVLG